MSTSIINDSMMIAAGPDGPSVNGPLNTISGQAEVEFATCDCCGLTEECTLPYIETIRERYGGKWICGLCAEAVKDEIVRCQKLISPDEAVARHISFCSKFRASGPPEDPTATLIRAMGRLMKKGLESPKSVPCSPSNKLELEGVGVFTRSESCIPSLTLVDPSVYRGLDEDCE
ncbi:hypothetical protein SASPL_141791 [Salvia splendens]|uniref:DUF1677 domain-containing protein n=1 Tax=Salvia splendens TaxID=180675 RepID=A0A8X8Z8U8_SALSN|nr:uncharacterized protein LOC121770801 [Salvia splendens]KAG6395668.1 hypothetical protein SASPL_141791 [Salvia splendens]